MSPDHYYQSLKNQILEATLSNDAYKSQVAHFFAKNPEKSFQHRLNELLEKPRFRGAHNAFASSIETMGATPIYINGIHNDRILTIILSILEYSSQSINAFWRLRDEFEKTIIKSDFYNSEILLELIRDKFGESLWYIRNKIIVLSYQGRSDELSSFCETCKQRTPEKFIGHLISYLQLVSDTDDAYLLLKSVVQKNVLEFKEAKLESAASTLCLLFSPDPLVGKNSYESCIGTIQAFTAIDQYALYLEIVQASVSKIVCCNDRNTTATLRTLQRLSAKIDDPLLKRAENLLTTGVSPTISIHGETILDIYEKGDYTEVIKYFNSNVNSIQNPLAYLNLIAKAYAYSDSRPDNQSETIINDLISHLVSLYTPGKNTFHSEDLLISRAIRLKGLTQWLYIQAAIYVALPQKYSGNDAKLASAKLLLVHDEATPIIQSILLGSDTIFGARYSKCQSNNVPRYRKLKVDICDAITNRLPESHIKELFNTFQNETPLRKEYYELYSEYCIHSKQYAELINVCAEGVVSDYSICNYFPMHYLIEEIEQSKIISIESLIVLFVYNNNISQSREYLLNETFEDYIRSNGVYRPSELLRPLESLTPLQIVFFQSICIPEIIDFLGCFGNIKELRSERVIILDMLLEKNLIDSKTRMLEVEELVGQLVVESAVSELNSGKIYVDDIALRKMLFESASGLFQLYKNSKSNNEERVTLIDEEGDNDSGTSHVYLSGNKSSITIKLYNLIANLFLFDEKYGIDKNLSTEIRHGFFSNLVRSKLEERHLITESDDEGKYKTNSVWREKNAFVTDALWEKIDGELALFSSNFNKLVESAEEWMKIMSSPSEKTRVFTYSLEVSDYSAIRENLDVCNSVDEAIDIILRLLWKRTESCLQEMRERLNVDFKNSVDKAFDDLIEGINCAKRGAALSELMNTIAQTKGDIKEDISKAAEWFLRTTKSELETNSLDIVIGIAVNAFKDVKGQGIWIDTDLSPTFRTQVIEGKFVKPYIIALVNLFDNCYFHSGQGVETAVKISGECDLNGTRVTIANSLSKEKEKMLLESKLEDIKSKVREPQELSLLRKEGGSGIVKALALLRCVNSTANIQFMVENCTFKTELSYAH